MAGRLTGKFPFEAGGESSTTAASEFSGLNLIDHLFGRQFRQCFDQRLIAAGGNVMFDIGGIDAAAVGQHAAHLFGVKGDLVTVKYRLQGPGLAVGQAVDKLAAFEGLSDDLGCIVRFHLLVLNP